MLPCAPLSRSSPAMIGDGRTPEEIADGFLHVAVANMANAIKKISVQRGYDVTEYVLNSFGGAGGQHACLVADTLGIRTVLIHPYSGVLSAYGMGLADIRATRNRAVMKAADAALDLATDERALEAEAVGELRRQGVADADILVMVRAHLRYRGTDTPIPITILETPANAPDRPLPGAERDDRSLRSGAPQTVRIRLRRQVGGDRSRSKSRRSVAVPTSRSPRWRRCRAPRSPTRRTRLYSAGAWQDAGIYRRERLQPGATVAGAALIIEPHQTIVVEPGWQAEVTVRNHIVLRRVVALPVRTAIGTSVDPVMLEVFNNLFMAIAEQMGVTLQNTAYSVNIKERLDFSCAVFDGEGRLVANAPHMPVHLGSMDRSVETIIRLNAGKIRPGDVFALNAPYNGGTHLPDITVFTPVFDDTGERILFWVASRGHHADVGGTAPGSMTPRATTVEEEGVLIDNSAWSRTALSASRSRRAAHRPPLPGSQRRPERRRPEGADRGQRDGPPRAPQDGRAFRPRGGPGLYGSRPGQRRGERAPGHRRTP